ncbi:MAG TPA: hypothetical protein VMK84_17105 [Streptosporangiaceae bacterium]|nr:hypothetical protein [Streptosporangiaceae bacterium]
MHVLIDDDLGRLTLRRLWPWHRLLARCRAPSLDRQLADGVRPETDAVLAARAMVLTSVRYRRDLAASLRRMLAASTAPQARPRPMAASRSAGVARQPHVPLRRDRIAGSASELDELARFLAGPSPLAARGVAMVSQLLADGGGPLYRADARDDLDSVIERAAQALAR